MQNDLSIPEGQADRRGCAVSPTFATGKLNEPMAPKNGNELPGTQHQESGNHELGGCRPFEAGAARADAGLTLCRYLQSGKNNAGVSFMA